MQNSPHSFQKFKKVPLLLSVIFLAFSSTVFVFLYKGAKSNQMISEKMQTEWQTEATRREGIKSLDRSIKAIEDKRILLESHFAQSSNVVPFLDTIEELALEAKAKSEVVSVDIPKEEKKLSVAIKTSGSFEALYRFLTLLENSPYELEFVSVDLQKSSKEVISEEVTASAEWTALFRVKLLSFVP